MDILLSLFCCVLISARVTGGGRSKGGGGARRNGVRGREGVGEAQNDQNDYAGAAVMVVETGEEAE